MNFFYMLACGTSRNAYTIVPVLLFTKNIRVLYRCTAISKLINTVLGNPNDSTFFLSLIPCSQFSKTWSLKKPVPVRFKLLSRKRRLNTQAVLRSRRRFFCWPEPAASFRRHRLHLGKQKQKSLVLVSNMT